VVCVNCSGADGTILTWQLTTVGGCRERRYRRRGREGTLCARGFDQTFLPGPSTSPLEPESSWIAKSEEVCASGSLCTCLPPISSAAARGNSFDPRSVEAFQSLPPLRAAFFLLEVGARATEDALLRASDPAPGPSSFAAWARLHIHDSSYLRRVCRARTVELFESCSNKRLERPDEL
jgi:hypothetical protein